MAKWQFDPHTGKPLNNNGGGNGYKKGGNNNNEKGPKHSGCKYGTDKNGNPYVRGWKYDKRNGMRSFLATPYSKTKAHKSAAGREWHNWMVKIQPEGQPSSIVSGLYDPVSKKVIVPELGFVLNPKGGKGGYTGTYVNRG